MKKVLIIVSSICVSNFLDAQTLYLPNGTNSISSSSNAKLELSKGSEAIIQLSRTGGHGSLATLGQIDFYEGVYDQAISSRIAGTRGPGNSGRGELVFSTLANSGGSLQERMRINYLGNIGIGTPNPQTQLEISEISEANIRLTRTGGHGDYASLGQIDFFEGQYDNAISSRIEGTRGPGSAGRGELVFSTLAISGGSLEERMRITYQGNVGIGTITTGSHKLAVEGTVGAREIKVEASGWSDFVFENDYELRTLEEVEQHINKNGHLPEIPSEAEVTENGINLGEMDAKLLQKIEELTLYLIEQNKKIEELTEKVQSLENK